MRIYNTLTREKDPIVENPIRMFVCGPTVYDFGHIGHARSAITYDILAKYLRFKNIKVNYIMNITDIDDKIIKRAQEANKPWDEIAKTFEQTYLEDVNTLGISAVDRYLRATDYMDNIKSQVDRLLKKKVAYVIEDDGIYFDISQFPDYGKLSKQNLEELKAGSRVDVVKGKRNDGDFVIWKFKKENEPSWDASFGEGRPGWHIEDTAITEKEFGSQYELHGGGLDLIFPHHECEIAQMESISGKVPLVKYWVHNGFITVNDEKMSKSLNNFWTIRDVLKLVSPRAARYYCLSIHYRAPINYSEEALHHAENAVKRLDDFVNRVQCSAGADFEVDGLIKVAEEKFIEAMDNDLETSAALAVIFDFIRDINRVIDDGNLSKEKSEQVLNFLNRINAVLGIFDFSVLELSDEAKELIKKREEARSNKDFKTADMIRDQLNQLGVVIEDTKDGVRYKKA